MQKLVIKNQFMGVKPCEIELQRFLLLIGEQASGKSTIAKLIYFFQTLPDTIYENALLTVEKKDALFNYVDHINLIARQNFEKTFGWGFQHTPFELSYFYNTTSFLRITQPRGKKIFAEFESKLGYAVGGYVKTYINTPRIEGQTRSDEIMRRQRLQRGLEVCFKRSNSNYTYMIAGRNATVAFGTLVEEKVASEIEKIVEDTVKQQDFEVNRRTGNEMLFINFVDWSKETRNFFRINGRTFTEVGMHLGDKENQQALSKLSDIATKILKGEYQSVGQEEYIKFSDKEPSIALKDASSGQQEVLRVLQGLYLAVGIKNRSEFFVIEEPEAHLYPLAQKELINAFAVFLNTIKEGRLIITTHSPYILTCVNILLLAYSVSQERTSKIEQKILHTAVPKDYWLNPDDFTAYSIGQAEKYCMNIKDDITGLVAENYLDGISELLGLQYGQLYDLLTIDNV